MNPYLQGGAGRRPGTRYFTTGGYAGPGGTRLVPFVYSKTEAYCYEAATGSNRVHVADLTTTSTPTYNGTNPIDWANYTEIAEFQYVQSADVLYIVHPAHKPARLMRTGGGVFAIQAFDYDIPDAQKVQAWPFRDVNVSATTLAINTTTVGTGRTLTASAALFNAGHVGALFVHKQGLTYGVAKVTGYTSPTVVTVTVLNAFGSTAAVTEWHESAWSDYRGWPRTVEIFQSRLMYGGNAAQPDTIWGSRAFSYDQLGMFRATAAGVVSRISSRTVAGVLTPDVEDFSITNESAITFTMSSKQVNAINWLLAGKTLLAGTTGGEHVFYGPNSDLAMGALNITQYQESTYGSEYVMARRMGASVLFVQRGGRKIREIVFNQGEDAYIAEDISLYADHLTAKQTGYASQITQIEVQEVPESRLWVVTATGGVFSCTRDRMQKVASWTPHVLGGTRDGGNPVVASLAVVPTDDGDSENIWLHVTRGTGGGTQIWIEVMQQEYELASLSEYVGASPEAAPIYSDGATVLANTPASATCPVGSRLNGMTVAVLADGKIHPPVVVASGNAVLSYTATNVIIGLPYTSTIKPVRPEAGSELGSAQGAVKRIDRYSVRFHRTVAAKIGTSTADVKSINFRPANVAANAVIPLFTGDKADMLYGNSDADGYVQIQTADPVPMSVLSITLRGVTHEV